MNQCYSNHFKSNENIYFNNLKGLNHRLLNHFYKRGNLKSYQQRYNEIMRLKEMMPDQSNNRPLLVLLFHCLVYVLGVIVLFYYYYYYFFGVSFKWFLIIGFFSIKYRCKIKSNIIFDQIKEDFDKIINYLPLIIQIKKYFIKKERKNDKFSLIEFILIIFILNESKYLINDFIFLNSNLKINKYYIRNVINQLISFQFPQIIEYHH
jgi:hypothetical protein